MIIVRISNLIFWISAGLILYTYFMYPLLLLLSGSIRAKPKSDQKEFLPSGARCEGRSEVSSTGQGFSCVGARRGAADASPG